jgi:hypothetical protein
MHLRALIRCRANLSIVHVHVHDFMHSMCLTSAHTPPYLSYSTVTGARDLEALQAFITEAADELLTETSS